MIGKKEKGNKNSTKSEVNYTFVDTGLVYINQESNEDVVIRISQVWIRI